MMFKAGDKVIFYQDYTHNEWENIYSFKKGVVYTVLDNPTHRGTGINNINESLEHYVYCDYLFERGIIKKYEPFEIRCEEDYYKWLANR